MQALGVLIDGGSCLGAAVAFHVVELKRIHAEFAGDAFERNPVVDLFSCVIAHIFIVVLLEDIRLGRRCRPFGYRWRTLLAPCQFARLLAANARYAPSVCCFG